MPTKLPEVLPEMEQLTSQQQDLVGQFVVKHLGDDSTICEAYQYLVNGKEMLREVRGKKDEAAATATAERQKLDPAVIDANKRIVACKFLVARKWKMNDASAMFTETAAWRQAAGFGNRSFFPSPVAIRGYDEQELMAFFGTPARPQNEHIDIVSRRFYTTFSNAVHKWDKQGHPVVFEHTGKVNIPRLLRTLKELAPPGKHFTDGMMHFRAFQNELMNALVRFQDAKFVADKEKNPTGRRVTSVTIVLDAKGVHMGMITGESMELLKRILQLDQKHYPELLHRMVIVNCSSLVMLVYNIVKVVLDARVREKFVFVYPEDTEAFLKSMIDEEHLPSQYGGTCKCEHGCIHTSAQEAADAKVAASGGKVLEDDNDDSSDGFVKTEKILVGAGKKTVKTITVPSKNYNVTWEWEADAGTEIDFEVSFRPQAASLIDSTALASGKITINSPSGEETTYPITAAAALSGKKCAESAPTSNGELVPFVTVFEKKRISSDCSAFASPCEGELSIVWNNKFSWVKGKTIRFRITELNDKN